jgi:hypothetical protein
MSVYQPSDVAPFYPLVASFTAADDGNGEYRVDIFLISSWTAGRAGKALPQLPLHAPLRLEDYRYGQTPLIKTLDRQELAGKTLANLMAESGGP